ncbi:MAG: YdeI/OmpD-associated family protein [Candidatus Acidiferrales bacterium]
MVSTNTQHRFIGTLYELGINRCVDVPEEVSRALGGRGYIPVVVMVQGLVIRTTLVPAGNKQYRLFIDGKIRKKLGVDAGDFVGITLRVDKKSNEVAVPEDVAAALRKTPGARRAFKAITPGLRREFLRWLLNAKRPETRAKRIERAIPILIERAQARRRRRKTPKNSR